MDGRRNGSRCMDGRRRNSNRHVGGMEEEQPGGKSSLHLIGQGSWVCVCVCVCVGGGGWWVVEGWGSGAAGGGPSASYPLGGQTQGLVESAARVHGSIAEQAVRSQ
jgi:hypothetical protein